MTARWLIFLLGFLLFVPASESIAQVRAVEFSFNSVLSNAPEFKQVDAAAFLVKNKDRKLWYLVSVSYMVPGKNLWLDGCSGELHILLLHKGKKGRNMILSGIQQLAPVKCGPLFRQMLFAIPPDVLDRYLTVAGISIDQLKKCPMRFIFRNNRRAVLGVGFSNVKDRSMWVAADKQHLPKYSVILPKDRSPWAWLYLDSFDMPRSMFEGDL